MLGQRLRCQWFSSISLILNRILGLMALSGQGQLVVNREIVE